MEWGLFEEEEHGLLNAWCEVDKRISQAATYIKLRLELGADVALMNALLQHQEQQATQKLPIITSTTPDAQTSIVLSEIRHPLLNTQDLHKRETVEVHGA